MRPPLVSGDRGEPELGLPAELRGPEALPITPPFPGFCCKGAAEGGAAVEGIPTGIPVTRGAEGTRLGFGEEGVPARGSARSFAVTAAGSALDSGAGVEVPQNV